MTINLDSLIIQIILNIIFISPVLWIAGRALAGREKAKLTDALWIAVLGTVLGSILHAAFSGLIAGLVILIMWLALIKHFFDCGWLKSLLIAVVAVVIFIIIAVVLAMLGFFALRTILPFA
ncbi:MAG: hypothetical protein V1857_00110 [archaeon]